MLRKKLKKQFTAVNKLLREGSLQGMGKARANKSSLNIFTLLIEMLRNLLIEKLFSVLDKILQEGSLQGMGKAQANSSTK